MDLQKDIRIEERNGRGRYVVGLPDGDASYLDFVRDSSGTMSIDYSFTPPHSRGRGVAAMLVLRAVQDAREARTKIVPRCSYVAAQFRLHPEWKDVLA